MTVRYVADLDAISAHIDHAMTFASAVEDAVTRLQQLVDDLHVTWVGAAALAHRGAHQRWVAGVEDMQDGLAAMVTAARLAHSNYLAAADSNLAMWGPLA